jgi:transcription elongation factor Elf1
MRSRTTKEEADTGDPRMTDKKYKCPNCGTECGPENIYGCSTFSCPKCGLVFEPEYDDVIE